MPSAWLKPQGMAIAGTPLTLNGMVMLGALTEAVGLVRVGGVGDVARAGGDQRIEAPERRACSCASAVRQRNAAR